jgi:hypothetical protein
LLFAYVMCVKNIKVNNALNIKLGFKTEF